MGVIRYKFVAFGLEDTAAAVSWVWVHGDVSVLSADCMSRSLERSSTFHEAGSVGVWKRAGWESV